MNFRRFIRVAAAHSLACSAFLPSYLRADGREGTVEWSDGKTASGTLSLSPGHPFRIFADNAQVSVSIDEITAIRFKPEKEEMREGFYFPNAGQATQAKTGEVYPSRSLQTEITLANGKILRGHLFSTTLYLEGDQATQKIVLLAKQTGTEGQKLSDLIYPTAILFDAAAASPGSVQIDLSQTGGAEAHPPVVIGKPDLALLPAHQLAGKSVWTIPCNDPAQLFYALQSADGWHVAWPADSASAADPDSDIQTAIQSGLKNMQDFYDTRTLLGCVVQDDDIFTLVMLTRLGTTYSFEADKKPWSLAILRWKYDATEKKVVLLNRAALATGRSEGNSAPPAVFKEPELLRKISRYTPPAPPGATP